MIRSEDGTSNALGALRRPHIIERRQQLIFQNKGLHQRSVHDSQIRTRVMKTFGKGMPIRQLKPKLLRHGGVINEVLSCQQAQHGCTKPLCATVHCPCGSSIPPTAMLPHPPAVRYELTDTSGPRGRRINRLVAHSGRLGPVPFAKGEGATRTDKGRERPQYDQLCGGISAAYGEYQSIVSTGQHDMLVPSNAETFYAFATLRRSHAVEHRDYERIRTQRPHQRSVQDSREPQQVVEANG